MEQMILKARYAKHAMLGALRAAFEGSLLLSSVLCGFASWLLALYAPAEGIVPFGIGCAAGAWYAGVSPYFACAGAFLGCVMKGNYAYAAAVVLLCAAIIIAERIAVLQRVYRLLLAFGAETLALGAASAVNGAPLALALGSASVSTLSAVILGHGICTAGQLTGRRALSDADTLTLAASLGLITLAIGNRSILGQSIAMVFAGVCVLASAYRCGMLSAAFAVTLGAGRVLATGGDMHFIAVLAAGALIAAALASFGKGAVAAGFAGVNLLFWFFSGGSGRFSLPETLLCCVIFMLIPKRLYTPQGAVSCDKPEPQYRSSDENSRLVYDVLKISEVLSSLAEVYGEGEGHICACVAEALRGRIASVPKRRGRFKVTAAAAGNKKNSSAKSGDSFSSMKINGTLLLCMSDGMGSGEAASRESRQAVELLCDLITVGFDMRSACDFVNGLLARRARGDMYATLDAMQIDLADGTASMVKLGAPPTYVLREDRLYTLYADNLPVGIIEGAEQPVRRVELKRGDIVIMMTDGVADALGHELMATVADSAAECADIKTAAETILAAAAAKSREDDMTVAVARIE